MAGSLDGSRTWDVVAAISELLRELSGAVTPAEVTEVFLARARELVGADAAAAAMRGADGESMVMLGIAGFEEPVPERWREFGLDPPTPMSDVLVTGEPIFLETASDVRARYPHLPVTGRAIAAAAARGRAGVIGSIAFRFPEARPLPPELRTVIVTIGEHYGLALDRAELFQAADSERQRLATLMQQLPVGVAIAEAPSGRIIAVNERATEIWRVPRFSEPISDVSAYVAYHPDGRRYEVDEWPIARSLATGETIEGEEVEVLFGDGSRGWVSISARPVTGGDGRRIGAVTTLVDVSARRRRENEARFMAESADLLLESLDPDETLRRLADLAVPRLADWCGVSILEGGEIRTVAVAHVDPAKVELAWEFSRRYPTDPHTGGVARVIQTGESQLSPRITRQMVEAAAPDADFPRIIYDELGLRSSVTVPLQARGERFGALTLVTAESGRTLDEHDQAFAEDFATHAALAVSNARLFAAQQDIADTLQQSLLPLQLPEIPGMQFATCYRAGGPGMRVGGDFFDVWQIGDEGSFGLAIGDVAGKGAAAAALTALARHTARTASLTLPSHRPDEVLREVNNAIIRRAGAGRFCTLATAHAAPSREGFEFTIACGGHPPPFIVRADGALETYGTPGTLLGVVRKIDTPQRETTLRPGDFLFAWTDGLVEHRRHGELFGEERLVRLLQDHYRRTPDELATAIEQAVVEFSDHEPDDDIAILIAKATPP